MTALDRVLATLPPPYAVERDAVLPRLLDAVAIEADVIAEDLDRLRQAHWVGSAYRFGDLDRLADLVGIEPLPGEFLQSFRVRLLALVAARLEGAVGPHEIRTFVYRYLSGAEQALRSTFVPGMSRLDEDEAFETQPDRPGYRPLALVENPLRVRRSASLAANRGRVPYLYHWQERNAGLADTIATFAVTGLPGRRTAVPVLVNLTTGDLVGYAGVLSVGQRLALELAGGEDPRRAVARLDDVDVTERLFSSGGFRLGVPFAQAGLDAEPMLPRLARGPNDWTFLCVGLFDVRGLDHVFFAIADEELREGVYNSTFFDHSLFPSGPVATLEMEWTEVEPASFEVHVPRTVVAVAPELAGLPGAPIHEQLAETLRAAVDELRAVGVRGTLVLEPFRETQAQHVRATLPWVVLEPEAGPAGEGQQLSLGGRYGESGLDASRFE